MKTDIDIKDDVYNAIKDSELHRIVNGILTKDPRPINSRAEDITISVLANRLGQIQEAFVTVNIFVRDQDKNGQWVENRPRLREISRVAAKLFESYHGDTFWLKLVEDEGQRVMELQASHEHFVSNKLLYKQANETI